METHRTALRAPKTGAGSSGLNGHGIAVSALAPIDESTIRVNELQLLTAKLEELTTANRRKDEFLTILSHELRSPLASIQYGIGVLRSESGADISVQRGMHELIERQARQMTQLAAGLLDVGRIASGHFLVQLERIDLRGVVAKAIETIEPDFDRRNQVLVPTWSPESTWVMADASRLDQVFVNLLANASKYTDAGGQISLSLSAEKGHAVVRIKDSGIGITALALPNIFELYVQADAPA
ncbi:MAG: HAMP domain-containing sensor histidine kinase, partial [Steroidobacteraceae bacterium]